MTLAEAVEGERTPAGAVGITDHCRWISPDLLMVVKKDHRQKLPSLQKWALHSWLLYRVGDAHTPVAFNNRWVANLRDAIRAAHSAGTKSRRPAVPLWPAPWIPDDWREAYAYLRDCSTAFAGYLDPVEEVQPPDVEGELPRIRNPLRLASHPVTKVRLAVVSPTTGVWCAENAVGHRFELLVPRAAAVVNPERQASGWRPGSDVRGDILPWAKTALNNARRAPIYSGGHLESPGPDDVRIAPDPIDAFVRRTRAFYPDFPGYPDVPCCENDGRVRSHASGPDAPRIS